MGSVGVAAWIAQLAFPALLVGGWLSGELGPKATIVFALLGVAVWFGLPQLREPLSQQLSAFAVVNNLPSTPRLARGSVLPCAASPEHRRIDLCQEVLGRPAPVEHDGGIQLWNVRPYSWQAGISIQHELTRRVALNLGYYRTWYGNFQVTDNQLVTAADHDSFCVTVPSTANLPNAGQPVCGLYDVKPALFGRVQNFVTDAKNFDGQSEVYNGVDVTLNARLPRAGIVTGGVSTGRTVLDSCRVREQLPETAATNPFCRNEQSWSALTAFKMSVTTRLPWDFQMSANYQNSPGVNTTAAYSVGAAEVMPSLGRPLASGPAGRTNVTVLEPNTVFREGRINQLGLAFTRNFRNGGVRFQPRIELHNALNANPILQLNGQVGPAFDAIRGVLAPRMVKFAFRVDF